MMDITRNQWFLAGLLLLFLGIEFRLVDSFDLNAEFSQFLAERSNHPAASLGAATQSLIQLDRPVVKRNIRPPDWTGWSLVSVGAVLILHSLAMKKPGA